MAVRNFGKLISNARRPTAIICNRTAFTYSLSREKYPFARTNRKTLTDPTNPKTEARPESCLNSKSRNWHLLTALFYTGVSFGAEGESTGEVVFNTSMTGYQEILTDPSYRGQIVTMTYPEIGNYGVNEEDLENVRPHLTGFVVREYSRNHSNFRSRKFSGGFSQESQCGWNCGN